MNNDLFTMMLGAVFVSVYCALSPSNGRPLAMVRSALLFLGVLVLSSCTTQRVTLQSGEEVQQINLASRAQMVVDPNTGAITMFSDGTEVGGLAVKTAGAVTTAGIVAGAYEAIELGKQGVTNRAAKEGTKQVLGLDKGATTRHLDDNATKVSLEALKHAE